MYNSTITGNQAEGRSGLYIEGDHHSYIFFDHRDERVVRRWKARAAASPATTPTTLQGTLLQGNTNFGQDRNCSSTGGATFASNCNNLSDDTTCTASTQGLVTSTTTSRRRSAR